MSVVFLEDLSPQQIYGTAEPPQPLTEEASDELLAEAQATGSSTAQLPGLRPAER